MPNVVGVLDLYAEVFGPPVQYDQIQLETQIKSVLENPDYRLFTIEIEGMVVATMMGVLMRNLVGTGKDQMILENIAVAGEFRGKGFGRTLYEQAEAWARENDCRKIIIVSNNKFGVGDFYRSLGFESDSSSVFIKRL